MKLKRLIGIRSSVWLTVFLVGLIRVVAASAGTISPGLRSQLNNMKQVETADVIVMMTEQADITQSHADRASKLQALNATMTQSQASVITYVASQQQIGKASSVHRYLIVNAFSMTATRDIIEMIATRPDVETIIEDRMIPPPPVITVLDTTPEWNIRKIRVPEVWDTYGIRGAGVVIGHIDTGVDGTHPDLASQFRGGPRDFYDAITDQFVTPYDDDGHGTHTMGTILGGDASGAAIGVVPEATWISAKALNQSGGQTSWILRAMEYMLDPDGNPETDDMPAVVSNSWGNDNGSSEVFRSAVQTWVALGIFPVFSNGNAGPVPRTVGAPASFPESFGVGATDISDVIADFSSRGPSPVNDEIKPEVSAPGVNVFSSYPGGGYTSLNGTSMAAPHVTGVVALLKQVDADLTIDDIRNILQITSIDLGISGEDNDFGHGRIDAFAAVTSVIDGGTLTGTITEGPVISAIGDPVAQATIRILELNISTRTDDNGDYSIRLPEGAYTVQAERDGYDSLQAVVTIVQDQTTVLDFVLEPVFLAVSPTSFADSLEFGAVEDHTLTISNPGGSVLRFTIETDFTSGPSVNRTTPVPGTSRFSNRNIDRGVSVSNPMASTPGGHLAPQTISMTQERASSAPGMSPPLTRVLAPTRITALAPSDITVGILASDSYSGVISGLVGTGFLREENISVIISNGGTPTLEELLAVDVVLAWSNSSFSDPDTTGDVLADYVDAGGSVVMATYAFSEPWRIGGRFQDPGYSPFLVTDTRFATSGVLDMSTASPGHPIFDGVPGATYWTNSNYTNSELNTDATALVYDTAGNRVVAVNGNDSVVGIMIWPDGHGENDPNVARLFANALIFVVEGAGTLPAWLTVDPVRGEVASDQSLDVNIQFNSADLANYTYRADIIIESNDPNQSVVTIPAEMTVFGAPDGDIAVAPSELTVALETGRQRVQVLQIYNEGVGPLQVADITDDETTPLADAGWLSEALRFVLIPPGETTSVNIIFDAQSLANGIYTANILINSSDPDEPAVTIPVTMIIDNPEMAIAPLEINRTLPQGINTTVPLQVTNTGGVPLEFSIDLVDSTFGLQAIVPVFLWANVEPVEGVVPPEESLDLTLALNTVLMDSVFQTHGDTIPVGEYFADLIVRSNDPENPEAVVQIRMNVVGLEVVINDIRISNSTSQSLTVGWKTHLPVDGRVRYGPTVDHLDFTAEDIRGPGFIGTVHIVRLTDLDPGAVYFYAVESSGSRVSEDNAGNPLSHATAQDVLFAPGLNVTGQVLDADGNPAEGVHLFLGLSRNSSRISTTDIDFSQYLSVLTTEESAETGYALNLGNLKDQNGLPWDVQADDEIMLYAQGGDRGIASREDLVVIDPAAAFQDLGDLQLRETITVRWDLPRGYSILGLPGVPFTSLTSDDLLLDIPVREITRWLRDVKQFDSAVHTDSRVLGTFPIEMGEGYFMKADAPQAYIFEVFALTDAFTTDLTSGLNMIAVPEGLDYTGHTLLSAIPTATEIVRWRPDTQFYESVFTIGENISVGPDFAIRHDEGYFARVTSDVAWTIEPVVSSAPSLRVASKRMRPSGRLNRLTVYPATPLAPIDDHFTGAPVTIVNLTPVSATVTWMSEESTAGRLTYGQDDRLEHTVTEQTAGRIHWIELTGLSPETAYRIQADGKSRAFTTPSISRGVSYTLFGRVTDIDGRSGAHALVTLQATGESGASLPIATLTDSLGFWTVNLGNLRDEQGKAYPWQTGQNLDVSIIAASGQATLHGPVTGESPQSATALTSAVTGADIPQAFSLAQSYPNPFNPVTTIRYELPRSAHVELAVYNVLGQKVVILVDERQQPGRYRAVWHGTNAHGQAVASGVYFYRISAGTFISQKKMLLLK